MSVEICRTVTYFHFASKVVYASWFQKPRNQEKPNSGKTEIKAKKYSFFNLWKYFRQIINTLTCTNYSMVARSAATREPRVQNLAVAPDQVIAVLLTSPPLINACRCYWPCNLLAGNPSWKFVLFTLCVSRRGRIKNAPSGVERTKLVWSIRRICFSMILTLQSIQPSYMM